ncbi:MAG TPA: MotA/TolQ/ExbB proton channel family protein [Bryobacteraceae bacterium]|jgi:chemotaxis protein MotA|nr:MotA/TolQ/ExbB proton channel family protein [Bryobacteraceae bacterium]
MKIAGKTDFATVAGALLAATAFCFGMRAEGIRWYDVSQLTAALIVFAGTAGAVLISMPLAQTKLALSMLPLMLRRSEDQDRPIIETLVRLARAARTRGIVSLEGDAEKIQDPFLRKALRLAVDGVGKETMETLLDADVKGLTAQAESAAAFYETAAGYAPSLGMAGAAIGLIQVMKHLDHIEQVGSGVAAAFVATIYGVLLANLLLLPIATKIRSQAQTRIRLCTLVREGVLAISSGLNPLLIRLKLEALSQLEQPQPSKARTRSVAA